MFARWRYYWKTLTKESKFCEHFDAVSRVAVDSGHCRGMWLFKKMSVSDCYLLVPLLSSRWPFGAGSKRRERSVLFGSDIRCRLDLGTLETSCSLGCYPCVLKSRRSATLCSLSVPSCGPAAQLQGLSRRS